MEKLLLSAEEKEREEEAIEVEGKEGDDDEDEEQEEDVEEKNGSGVKEKEQQTKAKAKAKKKKKKVHAPAQTKDKDQDSVLNLNNEVVKMRKEVKRVRVLIIRRLIRQISASKKKKGNEAQVEKSQRKAARMLEEIHAMKALRPDVVTKTALQKNLNFEQVCRDPKSTIVDRALARVATHPQFSKKIEDIKAAVEAFKKDRMKDLKRGGEEKVQIKAEKVKLQSPDKSKEKKREEEEENVKVQPKGMSENKEGDVILKDSSDAQPKTDTVIEAHSSSTADVHKKDITESESVHPVSTQSIKVKDTVKNNRQSKGAEKKTNAVVLQKQEKEEESDLESPEEEESDLESPEEEESDLDSPDEKEKEYFDDSTEERFYKRSSQSEESEDDFFIGKVSKYKKKKQKAVEGAKKAEKGQEVTSDKATTSDKFQNELDELESRLKSKSTSLQSVFTSLSGPLNSAGRGAGRGRGGDTFRGQRKPNAGRGFNKDFSKQSKFQKEFTGAQGNSGTKYSKPEDRRRESEEKGFASGGRGRGRGRGDFTRHMGRGAFSQQAPQQALHPSWEASKKRKEQQGQILAFQGKKIKFDD